MSKAWAGGSTTRWRKLRRAVLDANLLNNAGRCTLQIPGVCAGHADQVHHVRGKRHGDDPRYLAAVCKACNLHVGDPEKQADPPGRGMTQW